MAQRVLLTGISGFLGSHIAVELLNAGYTVRGSLRDLSKAKGVRSIIQAAGANTENLEFVALDLLSDHGWDDAMEGITYLQHTASPFVLRMPKDKSELIRPAVEGTERAINSALRNGVEHIVLTSSMAAVCYGYPQQAAPFTAENWTRLGSKDLNAYLESKTRAELKAWELVDAENKHDILTTINPSMIFGPLLSNDPGTSVTTIQMMMQGKAPLVPKIALIVVDVRDVAKAHVAAMTNTASYGQRILMGESTLYLSEIASILQNAFPQYKGISSRNIPNFIVKLAALFSPEVRSNLGEFNNIKYMDSSSAVALLGRPLIPAEEAIIASGQSLIDQNLIRSI